MKLKTLILLLFSISVAGCNLTDKQRDTEAKNYIDSFMGDYYYWYQFIPSNVTKEGNTPQDYFSSLIYNKDRWSWSMTGEQWNSNETGVYYSYGVSLSQAIEYYRDWSIRVRYVYPNSPFDRQGVKRGWQLTHIGGVTVETLLKNGDFYNQYEKSSNTFTFKDNNGVDHTFSETATTINTKSSLITEVFTSADFDNLPHNVGYFNYLTFNSNMLDDINSAFASFKQASIGDLILDLRYNGGGSSDATTLLASYLSPSSADGKIFTKRRHNDKLSSLNNSANLVVDRKDNSLELSRIFIITGKATASASELIINGLKPFLNVICVGDTTYGKPNGMYAFPFPESKGSDYYAEAEYVFLPICFFSVNNLGEGDYENGIVPNNYRADDLYHNWGVEEDNINSCLTYITTGQFKELPAPTNVLTKAKAGSYKIENREDRMGYGWDIDQSRL